MAGMLPGVEAARRRRIHNSTFNSEVSSLSRRPSFSLYATTHLFLPKSSTREFPVRQKELYDESMHLGVTVREAKKRLDLRFQSNSTSLTSRNSKDARSSRSIDNIATMQSRCVDNIATMQPYSQSHVSELTKDKPTKRLKWLKIGWK